MGGRRVLEDQPFSGCACPGGMSLLWCLGGPSCSRVRPSPRRLCTVVIRWVGGGGARPGRPHLAAPLRSIPRAASLALSWLTGSGRVVVRDFVDGCWWWCVGEDWPHRWVHVGLGCRRDTSVQATPFDPRSLAFVACVSCGEPVNLAGVQPASPATCGRCRTQLVWRQGFTLSLGRGGFSRCVWEDGRRFLVRTGRTGRN